MTLASASPKLPLRGTAIDPVTRRERVRHRRDPHGRALAHHGDGCGGPRHPPGTPPAPHRPRQDDAAGPMGFSKKFPDWHAACVAPLLDRGTPRGGTGSPLSPAVAAPQPRRKFFFGIPAIPLARVGTNLVPCLPDRCNDGGCPGTDPGEARRGPGPKSASPPPPHRASRDVPAGGPEVRRPQAGRQPVSYR